MPFSRILREFKKGTVKSVFTAVLLGQQGVGSGIYLFDIYGIVQIRVNILPRFPQHNHRRNRGKIENTHSIINFSELISKVCINYGASCRTRTYDLRINSPSLYRLS